MKNEGKRIFVRVIGSRSACSAEQSSPVKQSEYTFDDSGVCISGGSPASRAREPRTNKAERKQSINFH